MEKKIIIALHGFLGLPSDWSSIFKNQTKSIKSEFIDLWNHPSLNSSLSFSHWTKNFVNYVKEKRAQGYLVELWGYSMGGRLALSAYFAEPELYCGLQIFSSNPGLETEAERKVRLLADQLWSDKFLHLNWNYLMQEWDNQAVFKSNNQDGLVLERKESDYSREKLSHAIIKWSIGIQPNFWPLIPSLKLPVQWHVGELDEKYLEIGKRVSKLNSCIKLVVHPNLSHRLIFNPLYIDLTF